MAPCKTKPDEIIVINDLVQFITSRFPTVPGTAVYVDEGTASKLHNPGDGPPCLRGLDTMFLLATEAVAARPRYAQERTVTNFLTTLSLARVSSEVPKTPQLTPIALDIAFRTLIGVLEPLQSYSHELLEKTQEKWSILQNLVDELQMELKDVNSALVSNQKKLADLDSDALELLKDESFRQRFGFSPGNFKIHLMTEHPIRHVKETIGDDSKLHSSNYTGKDYVATVSNSAFKRGFARVELFGWKKDVYAAEILDLRSIASILIADRDDEIARLSSLEQKVAWEERRAANLLKTLEMMDIDLQVLRQPYGRNWDYITAQQQLHFGSLTSVAHLLGLKTVVPRWYPVYAAESVESPISPCPNSHEQITFAAAVEHSVKVLSVGLLQALPALVHYIKTVKVSLHTTTEGLRTLQAIATSMAVRDQIPSKCEDRLESTESANLKSEAEAVVESVHIQLEQLGERIVTQRDHLEKVIFRANSTTDEIDRQICNIDLRLLAVKGLLETLRGDEDVALGLTADLIAKRSPLKTMQSLLRAKQHQLALEKLGTSHSKCAAGDHLCLSTFGSAVGIEGDATRPCQGSSTLQGLPPQMPDINEAGTPSPVSVIVLGKTQAGKSSVLKALLEYGDHKELAEQVVTGRADVSITDEVSNYRALIPIQSHTCMRKTGEIVEEAAFQKMKDVAKRKLVYKNGPSTSWTVSLNLIDTPGLGDSRSMAEHLRRADQTAPHKSGEQGQPRPAEYVANFVDERHKLAIVAALNKSPSIDVVCLIIHSQDSLSGSVSAYLKQYVKLFKETSIDYVVIHTAVDYSNVSGDEMEQRKLHIDQLLGIRACHHVIQTRVNTERAYEAHALNLSIAGILSTFRISTPRSLGLLAYPKQDLHDNIDDTVRTVYDKYLSRLDIEIASKESEIKEIESRGEVSRLTKKLSVIDTQIRKLELEKADLNTSEEIWMDGKKDYEPYHSFLPVHSTIYFSFHVDHPIRKAVETHEEYGNWYGLWGCEGQRSLSCRWEARSDCYARAAIDVYTHKSDVHAVEISGLSDRITGRRAEKASVQHELEQLARKIKEPKDSIEECLALVRKATADRRKMDVAEYSPTVFPKTWFMFCGCDILCSSFGYQLALGLPDEMLGDVKDLLVGWKEALEKEEEEQDSRAEVCKLVVSSIEERITALVALQTQMSSRIQKHDGLMENVNLRLAQTEVAARSDNDVLVRSLLDHLLSRVELSTPTIQPHFASDVRQMMATEVEAACQFVVDVSHLYEEIKSCLSEEIAHLCEMSEALDAFLTKLQDIRGKWKGAEKHHRFQAVASAAAKRLITSSIQEKLLPVGAWAILNRAIEARKLLERDQTENEAPKARSEAAGDGEAAATGHVVLSLVRALAVFAEVITLHDPDRRDHTDIQSGHDDCLQPPVAMVDGKRIRHGSSSLGPLDIALRGLWEPLFGGLPRRTPPVNIVEPLEEAATSRRRRDPSERWWARIGAATPIARRGAS